MGERAASAQEHLLRHVFDVRSMAHRPREKGENHVLIARHEDA
jgi:hypothetical protein